MNYIYYFIFRFYRKVIKHTFGHYESFFSFEKKTNFLYTRIKARVVLGYWINLSDPQTFNEKAIHRRLFSRDSIWPVITNKNTVRNWLKDRSINDDILFTKYESFGSLEEILEYKVTTPVVIKAAWASGQNLFITSQEEFNNQKSELIKWFHMPYKVEALIWASSQMKKDFIVEEMLITSRKQVPIDLKLFCFSGKVFMIQTEENRFSSALAGGLFDKDGRLMSVNYKNIEKTMFLDGLDSALLKKSVAFAENISSGFDFLRVDLFIHNNDLYFAELSQTPHAGFKAFTDLSFDKQLGKHWNYAK